jgi:hypothetical protein
MIIDLGPTGIGQSEQHKEKSDSISSRPHAGASPVPFPDAAEDRGFTYVFIVM